MLDAGTGPGRKPRRCRSADAGQGRQERIDQGVDVLGLRELSPWDLDPELEARGRYHLHDVHAGEAQLHDILATVNATFNAFNTQGPIAICGAMAFQNIPITLTGRYTLRGFKDNAGVEEGQIPIDIG